MSQNRTLEEEKAALDKALNEFMEDCRARLHEMADRGKRGWDDPRWTKYIAMDMHADAREASLHGDRTCLHDIANRAMMLWWMNKPCWKRTSHDTSEVRI